MTDHFRGTLKDGLIGGSLFFSQILSPNDWETLDDNSRGAWNSWKNDVFQISMKRENLH